MSPVVPGCGCKPGRSCDIHWTERRRIITERLAELDADRLRRSASDRRRGDPRLRAPRAARRGHRRRGGPDMSGAANSYEEAVEFDRKARQIIAALQR